MIPEVGQHVKCMLKNGALAEGIVEEWYNNYVKLLACDHSSIIIIHHPEEDIVLTKIILDDDIAVQYKEPAETPPKNSAEAEFQKIVREPSSDLRNKRLAELKVELAKEERKIIAEKLRDHHIGEVKKVQYGIPGFLKKPRTE
jgi:hypothetical protein